MAVTHATATRTAIANAVVDLLDVGAGANGTLEFQTSGNVEVATLSFAAKATGAFGAATNGTANANTITSDTSATGGTIAKAVFKDCDGNTVLTCSVTATGGGGDIELSSVTISAGQTVSVSALSYSAPA